MFAAVSGAETNTFFRGEQAGVVAWKEPSARHISPFITDIRHDDVCYREQAHLERSLAPDRFPAHNNQVYQYHQS